MPIDERSISLPEQWAKDAQTVIPAPPVPGIAYRNTAITPEQWAHGQDYSRVADSAQWNQMFWTMSGLLKFAEQYGIMPYSPFTDYQDSGICMGSNGILYQAIQPSGPNNGGAKDIFNTSYWKEALKVSASGVDDASVLTAIGGEAIWYRLFSNREVLTTSGTLTFTTPKLCFVTCIGGGGGGGRGMYAVTGGQGGTGGRQGGVTSFGAIMAQGGSGGGGAGGFNEQSTGRGGGGGGAGAVVSGYMYISANTPVDYIVGAGGAGGDALSGVVYAGTDGEGPYGGRQTPGYPGQGGGYGGQQGVQSYASVGGEPGYGGNGGSTGLGYGGGGGGGAGQEGSRNDTTCWGGRGTDGAEDGQYTTPTFPAANVSGNGGRGGDGAIILYY